MATKNHRIPQHLIPALFLVFSFTLAISVRLINWQNYPFGFDQVQILQNAHAILEGHPTLIGPRTGPAAFFTGPLHYYLTALLLIFLPDIPALIGTSLVISLITGGTIYLLLTHYRVPKLIQIGFLILWALSPYLVSLDRIPWNPNLAFLASFLVFLPLIIRLPNQLDRFDLIGIFIGSYLGYQAHFTTMALPVLVAVITLMNRPIKIQAFAASVGGLACSLLPTLLFDLRHQWLNFHGLIALWTSGRHFEHVGYQETFFHNFRITLENTYKLLFNAYHLNPILVWLIPLILIILLWPRIFTKHPVSHVVFAFVWVGITVILFSLYHQVSPEYYFIIQFPALIWLILNALKPLLKHKVVRALFAIGFIFYTLFIDMSASFQKAPLGLGAQLATLHWCQTHQPIAAIDYQMDPGNDIGLRYLMKSIPQNGTGVNITLSQSVPDHFKLAYQSQGIRISTPVNRLPGQSPL